MNFDMNGGSGYVAPVTIAHGGKINQPGSPPFRTGYQLRGWSLFQPEGSALFDFPNTSVTANSTLYAQWTRLSYTVDFDMNGGSGNVASQTVEHGEKASNPVTTPSRIGYQFRGWSLSSTNGSALFNFSGTSIIANSTLYAQWTIVTYMVEFDTNGGSGILGKQSVAHGGTASLPANPPTRVGYQFRGWSLSPADGSALFNFSTTPITTNSTLYAQWAKLSYTVDFDANNGSGAPSAQTVEHGKYASLPTASPSRTGFQFRGWSLSSVAGSALFNFGGTPITSNRTLYAQWTAITYTVDFDANGGGSSPSALQVPHGGTVIIPTNPPIRLGYQFRWWSDSSAVGSPQFNPSTIITANRTLYAQWTRESFTLDFNPNGGSGYAVSQNVFYGEKASDPGITPTRTGYQFDGWATSQTAGSPIFDFANTAVTSKPPSMPNGPG